MNDNLDKTYSIDKYDDQRNQIKDDLDIVESITFLIKKVYYMYFYI